MSQYDTYLQTSFSEMDFWPVIDVFDDFILGRSKKRTIHNLRYGKYLMSEPFVDRLRMFQFQPLQLKSIKVEIGKRIPAFYLKDEYAIFGYVFLNTGSGDHMRVIFGSASKNEIGQSKYIIDGKQDTIVFINSNRQEDILY